MDMSQRELEMARGAEVAARAAKELGAERLDNEIGQRRETLRRWEDAGKVRVYFECTNPHPDARANARNNNRVARVNDIDVAAERDGPSWPSVEFVAQVGLAIGAMEGFDGVPEKSAHLREKEARLAHAAAERKRLDEARKYVTPPSYWDNQK